MSKKKYYMTNRLSTEDLLAHYEHMAKFWKAAGDKVNTSTYTNKAKKLREELGVVA